MDADGDWSIDRIQSNEPGHLNIPTEKIYDLGNSQSISTIHDIPEITFKLESFDVFQEPQRLPSNYRAIAINRDANPL